MQTVFIEQMFILMPFIKKIFLSNLSILLEKEMATHSSVLAWRILGTGEPGGLRSLGSHRVGHDWSNLAAAAAEAAATAAAAAVAATVAAAANILLI